jgi:hypothetical protein
MTEGLLQEIPLAEMMQLITNIGGATGRLELTPLFPASQPPTQVPVGQIFFREGKVHAAFLADRTRETALQNLFLWEAGFFTFQPCEPQDLPPPNVSIDSSLLLLKGIERLGIWTTAREVIPTMHIVLRRVTPAPSASPLPEPRPDAQTLALCNTLLPLCDGQLPLTALAQQMKTGRMRCREAAAVLVQMGLVVIVPSSAGEKLMRLVANTAYPMLGVAAELFCEDALRALNLPPEHLDRVNALTVHEVAQVITHITREVSVVLGPQRARDLAAQLRQALGIGDFEMNGNTQ